MKRIIVVCEGQTEQEFCRNLLSPHFSERGITIEWPTINKSNGGIVHWNSLKRQIERHLKKERSARVTTLLDYLGIQAQHGFPSWRQAHTIADKSRRMESLEAGMRDSLDDNLRWRFIPYLQLHEFEALLFTDAKAIQNYADLSPKGEEELAEVIEKFPNPEMINGDPPNWPSGRMSRMIAGYDKVIHGNILADEIGLPILRERCPRFGNWITQLEELFRR